MAYFEAKCIKFDSGGLMELPDFLDRFQGLLLRERERRDMI